MTGRKWIDFVSFDPRLPDKLQLVVIRVTRSEAELKDYERELRAFLNECDVELQALRTMANLRGVLEEATV